MSRGSALFGRTLELAGGRTGAKLVYVPTNGGGSYSTPEERKAELDRFLETSGWGDLPNEVILLHTYDRNVANVRPFLFVQSVYWRLMTLCDDRWVRIPTSTHH